MSRERRVTLESPKMAGDLPPDFEPSRADKLFGQIAVSRHFVAPHHVREGLADLAGGSKKEKELCLADILLRRGYVTKTQRRTIEGFVKKELGPERIGRYELVEKIGEGGMGTVYRARDGSTGRTVALKVLPRELARDKIFMGRFQREAIAVTRLDHPNIVRGLDVGAADGLHFIAMEFIEGIDCDKMLARRGRIPEREAAHIALQIAKALAYAHTKRLVHRDIKPANIILMNDGTAKLTDLGLAKSTSATAAKLTQPGITMGTPHYISPEQAMGASDLDIRSDIYSLGATLYQFVTGRVPFEGSSPAIIVAKHLTEELENPGDIVPELSKGVTLVLEKMLAKDRDDRYSDPGKLVSDLEAVAAGKAPDIEGLRPGLSTIMKAGQIQEATERLAERRRERLRGRRTPVALLVGVTLGLGIAVGVVVLLFWSPGAVERVRSAAQDVVDRLGSASGGSGGWSSLLDGRSLSGWRSFGALGWGVSGDFIESAGEGLGRIETARTFREYHLRAEFAASEGAETWIILGKPATASRGGFRALLPARGRKKWTSLEATVKARETTAFAAGKRIPGARGRAGPEGVIGFEVRKGTLRFRDIRVQEIHTGAGGKWPPGPAARASQ